MLNKAIRQAQDGNNIPPYTFSDENTKEKIRRHLKDINDVITEKDIKNAKVPGAEKDPAPVLSKKKSKKSKENTVDDAPGNPVTPWDVVSE